MKNIGQLLKLINFAFIISLYTQIAHANAIDAIIIETLDDQSQTIVPDLKSQYQLCVQLKQTIQTTKREKPEIWPTMKKSLKPGYIVDSKPAPEPEWDKLEVGKFSNKEYFYGDKYAKYVQRSKYKISKDGLCTLLVKKTEKIEIDNGKERFLVSMKGYIENRGSVSDPSENPPYKKVRVKRYISPVVTRINNDRKLNTLISEQPQVVRYLNTLLDSGANRTPGTDPGISSGTIDILRESFGIEEDKGDPNVQMPRADDEHFVLGHTCDIVSGTSLNTRLWYYQRMHHYPSIMRRPIILKSEVKFGDRIAIKEATRFQSVDHLEDKIFTPPRAKR